MSKSPDSQYDSAVRTAEDHKRRGRCGSCSGGNCWTHLWALSTIAAAEYNDGRPAPSLRRRYGDTSAGISPWAGGQTA